MSGATSGVAVVNLLETGMLGSVGCPLLGRLTYVGCER